ncbi:hypothetical protein [Microtetraspora sp. NBRC 16547]|uniref:hypothetical protein n=1 Tax=Microtetraspora sp. NBRC 16547 TaxID=3030993 RepID=UPI0024A08ED2|nr:hypothetical protein [Microtetraspora sp. NBRC 16547]GLX02985.1 hypothetical protein Misp02_70710 [Microtetraspora sp. NBRC 16547]
MLRADPQAALDGLLLVSDAVTAGTVTHTRKLRRVLVKPPRLGLVRPCALGIPRTLSGKKLEVPVRKILLGTPVEQAANPDSMANPEVLRHFMPDASR